MTTISLGTLRREQMNNATGISSLMRNLGGGIGISAATTILARSAQTHQATLVSHLTVYDPAFRERLQQLQGALGTDRATAALYSTLLQQASLMAFIDIFYWLAALCLLCVPLVFLLKRVKAAGGAGAAMH